MMRFRSHGKEHCHWASGSQLEDEVANITSETAHPIPYHILGDMYPQKQCCENLKSHTLNADQLCFTLMRYEYQLGRFLVSVYCITFWFTVQMNLNSSFVQLEWIALLWVTKGRNVHSRLLKSSTKCKAGVANSYSLASSNGNLYKFCNLCVQPLFLIWKVLIWI